MYNLLKQFFTLGSSKIEVFETYFFDIVTTQYDHPGYINHVLGRIYVFSTLFRDRVGGGVSQGIGTQLAYTIFHPGHIKNRITSQRLLDQARQAYIGEDATYPPFSAFLSLFSYPTPRG